MDPLLPGGAALVCSIALIMNVRYRHPSTRIMLLTSALSGVLLLLGFLILFAPETCGGLWSSVLPAGVSPWLITLALVVLAVRLVQQTLRLRQAARLNG